MLTPVSQKLDTALTQARKSIAVFEAKVASVPIHNPHIRNKSAGHILAAMSSRPDNAPTSFKSATRLLRSYKSDMMAAVDGVTQTIRDAEKDVAKWHAVANHIEGGGQLPELQFELQVAVKSVRNAVTAGYFNASDIATEIRRSLASASEQIEDAKQRRDRVRDVGKIASAKRMSGACQVLAGVDAFSPDCRKMFARTAELAGTHAKARIANYRTKHGKFSEASL